MLSGNFFKIGKTREIHIVLDIDGTFATAFDQYFNITQLLNNTPCLQAFDEKQFIHAVFPHFLHPGTLEFIQWILQLPNVKLSFFSSGHSMRNIPLIETLLTRATGAYIDLTTLGIYSREHLYANVKNLAKLPGITTLDSVILVDDNPFYSAPGQKKNMLITPYLDVLHFENYYKYPNELPDYEMLGETLQAINHIFYVTGVLTKIMSMENDSLANNLYKLQYIQLCDDAGIDSLVNKPALFNDPQYYLDGLSELRKINPELDFYGGDFASEFFNRINCDPNESDDSTEEGVCSLRTVSCPIF